MGPSKLPVVNEPVVLPRLLKNNRKSWLRQVSAWALEKEERTHEKVIRLNIGSLFGSFGAPREFLGILADGTASPLNTEYFKSLSKSMGQEGRFGERFEKKWNRAWDGGYFESEGFLPLREAIRFKQLKEAGKDVDTKHILTSSFGGAWFIEHLAMSTIDSSSGWLLPDRCYPSYITQVMDFGGHLLMYKTDDEGQPVLEDIERQIKNAKAKGIAPKGIAVINPNNPMGAIYKKDLLEGIVEIARKNGIFIIADEVYYLTVFRGSAKAIHVASLTDEVPIIQLGSLSKEYQLCGSRVGWAVLNNFEGEPKMMELRERLVHSQREMLSSSGLQVGAALLVNREDHLPGLLKQTRARHEIFEKGLAGAGCIDLGKNPDATYYHWVGVNLAPQNKVYFRAALVCEPEEVAEACRRITSFCEKLKDGHKMTDVEFAKRLVDEANVAVSPEIGFTHKPV